MVAAADHVIRPQDVFTACIERAAEVAQQGTGSLVTFGMNEIFNTMRKLQSYSEDMTCFYRSRIRLPEARDAGVGCPGFRR